jgi:YcaO-like protein with predicted kinase domain
VKRYLAGTHRALDPTETLARWLPVAPRLGITRVANVTGLDVIGIPVYVAIRPNSRALAVSQGKGLSPAAAKASALMESVETWHAERIRRPCRVESPAALQAEAAVVDLAGLTLNTGMELDPSAPMTFVEGVDFATGGARWVPFEAVSANFVLPKGFRSTFLMSTNGLASGNVVAEAIVHAVCEVIERDAISLWERMDPSLQKARQLDAATIDDPYCQEIIDRLRARQVRFVAWEITSDVGVPCYAATLFEDEAQAAVRASGMFSGYGCHLDPGVALSRALTEAVQSRLTMVAGSRDDLFYADFRHNRNPDDLRGFAQWVGTEPGPAVFGPRPGASETFEEDLRILWGRLTQVGVRELVVVDLTREELGIPVVKVIIPGLAGPFRPTVPSQRIGQGGLS